MTESKKSASFSLKIYNFIFKAPIYLLFLLFPLFFLTWTSDALDFNKQALLISLVSISFFAWMLKVFVSGRIKFVFSNIHIFVAVFLLIAGVSTYFSLYRYGSFWGWGSAYNESLLTLIALSLLYFLISNSFEKKEIFHILSFLAISTFFSALYGIFQIFGKYILPFSFSKAADFNTIGTVNSMALFAAVMLPIIICMIMASRRVLKGIFIAILAIDAVLLILANFNISWIIAIVGMLLIMAIGVGRKDLFNNRWLALPMFFLVVSALFIFFKFQVPGLAQRPIELYLKNSAGLEIGLKTLKEKPIFGSGLGTFGFDYAKYKDDSLNKTSLWNFKTDNAGSKAMTILATQGILGIISYIILMAVFIYKGLFLLVKKYHNFSSNLNAGDSSSIAENNIKSSYIWILGIGIFSSFVSLAVSSFLYNFNMTLEFIFFAIMAAFVALAYPIKKEIMLKQSSLVSLFATFCFTIIFIFSLGLLVSEGQRYLAEVYYNNGLTLWSKGDSKNAVSEISKAAETNPKSYLYLMDLSKAYLQMVSIDGLNKNISKDQLVAKIQAYIKNSVNAAVLATNLNPNNVAVWSVKGYICQNLIGAIPNIDEWAINSYEEAMKLEPLNPYYPAQEGIVYLTKYYTLEDEKDKTSEGEILLVNAKEKFEKAIELKSDYAPARFQLAVAYNLLGKTSEAIAELEATKKIAPSDVGLAFQLGLAYYQNNDFDKAQKELERAVSLNNNYSNALYFLGLTYDKKGNKDKAIEMVGRVLDLNPDNEEVEKVLENLKFGRGALEGITENNISSSLTEENPEEIKMPETLEENAEIDAGLDSEEE